jgi:hypothetical protein
VAVIGREISRSTEVDGGFGNPGKSLNPVIFAAFGIIWSISGTASVNRRVVGSNPT